MAGYNNVAIEKKNNVEFTKEKQCWMKILKYEPNMYNWVEVSRSNFMIEIQLFHEIEFVQ